MTNINLLPPEIAQKRKMELRRLYVFFGAGAVAGIIVLVYLGISLQVSSANAELERLKQKSQRLSAAKVQLQQFADRKTDLQKKQKIVQQVVENEVDWAKLLNEISMVQPAECWVKTLKGSESDGMSFEGSAIDQSATAANTSKETTTTDVRGHKPVAKWLVRMTLLQELTDVWLTESLESAAEGQPTISFKTTAKWKSPHTAPSASAAPAPPAANPTASAPPGGG